MRSATPEEFTRIMAIIQAVTWTPTDFDWHGNRAEALALCKSIHGYKPKKGNCHGCETQVLNILREAVNLPGVNQKVSAERYERRMALCRACPAFHPKTVSCGRLGIDALTPKPVDIDGVMVKPCSCFLPLKAIIKHTSCPANKW